LARDTTIVGLHQLLPAALADRWLPSVSGSWTNFGEESDGPPLPDDESDLEFAEWKKQWQTGTHESVDYADFLETVTGDEVAMWYQHEMLPHMSYRFLPDGRTYQGSRPRSLSEDFWWSEDPMATVNAQQRLLLQLQYADAHVSALLDRLREQDMLEESLIVVVADHGIDLAPGRQRRGAPADEDENGGSAPSEASYETYDAMLPVPLFVKVPGQRTGVVDDRSAQTLDVLPTIADALALELPEDWEFDGTSLLSPPPDSRRPARWLNSKWEDGLLDREPDAARMARSMSQLFGRSGTSHDVYAVGPYADLVGQPVGPTGSDVDDAMIENGDLGAWSDVDLGGSSVPALFTGDASGIEPGSWIAFGLNGDVAGIGPVFRDVEGNPVVEIMIDPAMLEEGENQIGLYLVSPDSGGLLPIGIS
jgi:hypothetical protein